MKCLGDIYMRERDKRESSRPSSKQNPQPLDLHRAIERGEHGAQKFNEYASRIPKCQERALGS